MIFRGTKDTPMTAAAAEEKFWTVVDANASLSESKGTVVSRNSAFSPITHQFDLRISQEVPGFFPKHKGIFSFDILNIGNLFNKEWGRIDEVNFQDQRGANTRNFVNFAGIDPATGKMIYAVNDPADLTTKQNKGESQWALQVTLKYEF